MAVTHSNADMAFSLERTTFGEKAPPQQEDARIGRDLPVGAATQERLPDTRLADREQAQPAARTPGDSILAEGPAVEEVADRLAQSFARAIVTALQALEKRWATETRSLATSVERQGGILQRAMDELATLQQSIVKLAESVSGQNAVDVEAREGCNELAAEIEDLRRAGASHEAAMAVLRRETQDATSAASGRLESLLGRLQSQQEDLLALRSAVGDVPPRVAAIVERLDRQAEAIRSLHEMQERRHAALCQFGEALTSLKASLAGSGAAPAADL